jgi:hypothetical protein
MEQMEAPTRRISGNLGNKMIFMEKNEYMLPVIAQYAAFVCMGNITCDD